MAKGTFIEEFLYRGRSPSLLAQGVPPAWHVVLGVETKSALDGSASVELSQPMTPTEAEARGFSLDAITDLIDASTSARVDELEANVAHRDDLLKAAEKERDKLIQALSLKDEAIASLRLELAAANAASLGSVPQPGEPAPPA